MTEARQGNIAALLQVLNEELGKIGVRGRAIFTDGILHLLCESDGQEYLKQSELVPRIQEIFTEIAPTDIQRVKINARISQPQQIFWLDAINKDPANQLLWSQSIDLVKPNILQVLGNGGFSHGNYQFIWGLITGLIFGAIATALYHSLSMSKGNQIAKENTNQISIPVATTTASPSIQVSPSITLTPSPLATTTDTAEPLNPEESFKEAVRLAQSASDAGKVAQTREDWLAIAERWQKAADLMASIPPEYERYDVATDRAFAYQQNSYAAQGEADKYPVY
ncbi:MAG: hypothetical protein ACRC2J_06010 [Microcoleaceae cyanobacterium]